MRTLLMTALLTSIAIPALPAQAQDRHDDQHMTDQQREQWQRDQHRNDHYRHGQNDHGQNGHDENGNWQNDHRQSWSDRQAAQDAQANERDNQHDVWHQQYGRQQRRVAWQNYRRYDYNQPDPRYGSYQAERYYRDGRYYQQQTLGQNDRIYRGGNGRYYCRRSDGTTGLIIGALGGGLLGNAIAPRGSKTLGAILGGGVGALAGQSIDRNGVHCR